MGGVTRKEDTAVAIPSGHVCRSDPGHHTKHFNVEIRYADRKANELRRPLLGELLDIVSVCCEVIDQEPPPVHPIDRQERGPNPRMLHEIESRRAIGRPRPEIGLKKDVYAFVHMLLT